MTLVDDQDAVEEFATQATDEALGDRVGPRCAHRRADDADIDRGEDGAYWWELSMRQIAGCAVVALAWTATIVRTLWVPRTLSRPLTSAFATSRRPRSQPQPRPA